MRLSVDTTYLQKLWFKDCSVTTKNYFGYLSSHLYVFWYYYHTHKKKVQGTKKQMNL